MDIKSKVKRISCLIMSIAISTVMLMGCSELSDSETTAESQVTTDYNSSYTETTSKVETTAELETTAEPETTAAPVTTAPPETDPPAPVTTPETKPEPVITDAPEPPVEPVIQNEVNKEERTVYIVGKGKRHHSQGCRYVKGDNVVPMSLSDAVSAGYTPCKVCGGG